MTGDGALVAFLADTPAATLAVLVEAASERRRQVEDCGWTAEHDDTHGRQEWAWLLLRRVSELDCPWLEVMNDDPRRLLVEIIAVAAAAIESLDRQASALTATGPDPEPPAVW